MIRAATFRAFESYLAIVVAIAVAFAARAFAQPGSFASELLRRSKLRSSR